MRVKSNENKYEYEVNGARQSYDVSLIISQNTNILFKIIHDINEQSDRFMLSDNVRHDLEEKIRKLEEDRHNIDITSGKISFKILNYF